VLKKICLICFAVGLAAWLIQGKIDSDRIKDEKQKNEDYRINLIKSQINALENATQANSSWLSKLSHGEKYRSEPILSLELENVWISESPILFYGSITDISTMDSNHYRVDFEQGLLGSLDFMFSTELRISLKADKSQIDQFLTAHPELFENYGFNNGVAVAASIASIRSSQISDTNGEIIDIKTGEGDFLGMVYLGRWR